jgi:hypothetical protein
VGESCVLFAQTLLTESTQLTRGQRDPINGARSLLGFAHLAAARGQAERAVRLAGAISGVLGASGAAMPDSVNRMVEQWLTPAQAALGAAASEVWASGQRLSLDEATEYALRPDTSDASVGSLTDRELEVASLVAQGLAIGAWHRRS